MVKKQTRAKEKKCDTVRQETEIDHCSIATHLSIVRVALESLSSWSSGNLFLSGTEA